MQKNHFISCCYNPIFTALLPLAFARLGIKGLRNQNYLKRWPERLGRSALPLLRNAIWIHAVSVGEVRAATPLIKHLLGKRLDNEILVTCTTPTGSAQIRKSFGTQVRHCYLPLDSSLCLEPFFTQVNPALVLIMETEIWPNLFYHCQLHNSSLYMVNARLSRRSFQGYRIIRPVIKKVLEACTKILCQSAKDKRRFIDLGVAEEKIYNCGNLKFDCPVSPEQSRLGESIRNTIGERPVWIGASTHPGEEEMLLGAHQDVLISHPQALLILVPRHPERFNHVFQLCQKTGLKTARRSLNQEITSQTQIYLGDTMGELPALYAAADLSFVGGSLIPIGGHNLLEPSSLGKAVLSGPHLENFQEISQILLDRQALLLVKDREELASNISQLFAQPDQCRALGEKAKQAVDAHRGAVDRVLHHLYLS